MTLPSTRLRFVLALATAIATFSLLAGSASAENVRLDWSQAAVYNSAAATNTDRTWLGYITGNAGNGSPSGAGGFAHATAPATGSDVTTSSPRGADQWYTFGFPATTGSLDAITLAGTLNFEGTLRFEATNHGFAYNIQDPKLTIDATKHGKLTASGSMQLFAPSPPMTIPFPSGTPMFDLDFTKSTCTLNADGTLTLGNIIPSLTQEGTFFPGLDRPGGYAAGAGPERTPNTFGTLSLANAFCAPLTGPAGPQGATGPQGPAGKDASVKTFKVRRSPFNTKKSVLAKVTKNKKFVGYAVVTGRKIKLTYVTKSIKGNYKFNPVPRKYKTVTVRFNKTH